MPIYKKSGEQTSAVMMPTGNGLIDVVNDYTWTLSNNRSEVPTATLVEYQINSGQLLAGIYYYAKQTRDLGNATFPTGKLNVFNSALAARGGGVVEDPYRYLYFATPTNFVYSFPYFASEKFGRDNKFDVASSGNSSTTDSTFSFGRTGNASGEKVPKTRALAFILGSLKFLGNTAKYITSQTIPGKLGVHQTQSWDSTTGINYTISFSLLNTFKNTDEIRKNRELAYLLTYQNSPFRRNIAVIDPICIYTLSIPDVAYFPACYVSNLAVNNLGTTRLLNLDGVSRTIPEAYEFSITLTSLIEESRNVFSGVEDPTSRVKAISPKGAWDAIKDSSVLGDITSSLEDDNIGVKGLLGQFLRLLPEALIDESKKFASDAKEILF